MKRKFRLTSSIEFKRVRRLGKSYAHPLIVLIILPNECMHSRFGVTAGRSLGNAVKRNRAKRLMREALRQCLPCIIPGWDLVLIARQPMSGATLKQTQQALTQLLKRAGIYTGINDDERSP